MSYILKISSNYLDFVVCCFLQGPKDLNISYLPPLITLWHAIKYWYFVFLSKYLDINSLGNVRTRLCEIKFDFF